MKSKRPYVKRQLLTIITIIVNDNNKKLLVKRLTVGSNTEATCKKANILLWYIVFITRSFLFRRQMTAWENGKILIQYITTSCLFKRQKTAREKANFFYSILQRAVCLRYKKIQLIKSGSKATKGRLNGLMLTVKKQTAPNVKTQNCVCISCYRLV